MLPWAFYRLHLPLEALLDLLEGHLGPLDFTEYNLVICQNIVGAKLEQNAYSGHSRVKLIKNAKNISYVFSLLCPIMPSMIMPNYAPTKPHLGPKFCTTYIPEDYQIAINRKYLKKASQYLLEKFW